MFPFLHVPDAGHTQSCPRGGRERRRLVAAVTLILAVWSQGALAVDAPLSLAEAQGLALARSRQLVAQDAGAAASQDLAVAARQLPDPVLRVGVDNLPVTGTDRYSLSSDFMTMRRVGLMQELTRSDKRRLRAERFEREADKALAEKDRLSAEIERDTALAWLDRYYAEAMMAVLTEQRAQAKLAIEAAEGTYRGGRGSQADVLAARVALGVIDDRASELDRKLQNATVRLERWVGAAARQPLFGRPDIDKLRFDLATLDTSSLGAHLVHHPEIAVLGKQEQIAQAEADLAKANEKPDWTVEVNYLHRGPAFSDMVSVGVSVPLQWDRRNRQDRELAAKLAAVEQAKDEREEMLRQHLGETRAMINEWQNDRERRQRYERELIPLAVQRGSAALAAYRGGKAGIGDVLSARRDEIDLRLQALQLEASAAQRWAYLNFLYPSTKSMPTTVSTERK
ncbi:TolC family protein [Massilia sp. LXY-6]